jgi:hypothetical protein
MPWTDPEDPITCEVDAEGYWLDDDGQRITCWCGEPLRDASFGEPEEEGCGGTGYVRCECGGDSLCVCHYHGEAECPGCEDCEEEDYSADDEGGESR